MGISASFCICNAVSIPLNLPLRLISSKTISGLFSSTWIIASSPEAICQLPHNQGWWVAAIFLLRWSSHPQPRVFWSAHPWISFPVFKINYDGAWHISTFNLHPNWFTAKFSISVSKLILSSWNYYPCTQVHMPSLKLNACYNGHKIYHGQITIIENEGLKMPGFRLYFFAYKLGKMIIAERMQWRLENLITTQMATFRKLPSVWPHWRKLYL